MADNVGYTPGSGATIAADEIGGVLHQRVKISHGVDGSAVDTSASNPMPVDASYGELVEAVESLRMAVQSLTRGIAMTPLNSSGQAIIDVRQLTGTNLNMGTVNFVQEVTTLRRAGASAYEANDLMPNIMRMGADTLRTNIKVT